MVVRCRLRSAGIGGRCGLLAGIVGDRPPIGRSRGIAPALGGRRLAGSGQDLNKTGNMPKIVSKPPAPPRPPQDHPRPGRAGAQPQECRPGDPARRAGGVHGAVRLGQVVAGVRHHLRRRPAALCGEPVGLCAPVPGDDAEARCGPHRRALAGHLHRAEDHLQEPALHGRHRHRDLRLPAPAVRARRRALLAGHGPAHREPDGAADGRPGAGAARGHAALPAGADRARAGRASTARSWPSCRRRASSASRSTASSTRSPTRPSSTRSTSTTSTWWWTAWSCGRTSPRRLADSFETALELADGIAIAEFADKPLKAVSAPRK